MSAFWDKAGHYAEILLQPHGGALVQSAGNANTSLVQNKTPAGAAAAAGG
jgi:hypothetical protein